ncbi:RNA methyltransferase [candidate division KSB1 bacterium]|nr:RNA methyltransferase [candidate division KSB1 bacterium]
MNPSPITSIKDPIIIAARALSTLAGRREQNKCLLEGAEAINWALEAGLSIEHVLLYDREIDRALLEALDAQQIPMYTVSSGILKKVTNSSYLIPAAGIVQLPSVDRESAPLGDFVLLLDNVQDHGNIGTIVRTARGFGVRDILLSGDECDLYYRRAIKASRGKVFKVRALRFESGPMAVDYLKERNYQVVAASPHAPAVQSLIRLEKKPLALVVGNETEGVSQEILDRADLVVRIPMSDRVESLNVGVATGISLYELKYKLVIAMLTKKIRTTLGREVNVAGKLIQMALDAELGRISPFNSTQIIFLMVLKCDGVMTEDQANKDTATFGEAFRLLIQPLLDGNYIQYMQDENETVLTLTGRGDELLGQLWGVIEASEERILQDLTDEETGQLVDYLHRIQNSCIRLIG